jgi:hypothetical protein
MAGALIVTAELGREDFAWIDALRRAHYPSQLNCVRAHLTIFHTLPPSSEREVSDRLAEQARGLRPKAQVDGLLDLGGGVAFRVVSPDLDRLRGELADDLHGLLGAQDSGGWRPHVTIQNKVAPKVARALLDSLGRDFQTRRLTIAGLGLHRYLGGPWETIATWPFRGIR